jgi:P-type conjugative transfer ATPase TrbB
MTVHTFKSEALARGARMLRTALGADVAAWLEDPAVVEVMLNPDGRLWVDRLSEGLADTGEELSAADGERIVRLVAHHVGAEVHAGSPRVSAELPGTGERFEGLLPPVVAAPVFAIRKPAVAVFTLEDYVAAGIMPETAATALCEAIGSRANILVAGGTSTGKTTLTNALLAEVAKSSDRIVLIEDTRELQCLTPNLVALRTKDGVASLSDLVRSSLRLRLDRIPIGEVRGAEALDLLKAWGTGHPGGIGTIHAGSALGALRRLEQLIQEAVVTVPRAMIAETIDLIAVLSGRGSARRLSEFARVEGLDATGDTARWIIGDTQSGSGDSQRIHILVKPTRPDLQTNLVINTDRRTYHLELRANPSAYMASVSWTYAEDALIALRLLLRSARAENHATRPDRVTPRRGEYRIAINTAPARVRHGFSSLR